MGYSSPWIRWINYYMSRAAIMSHGSSVFQDAIVLEQVVEGRNPQTRLELGGACEPEVLDF